jgi:hypothetical protein
MEDLTTEELKDAMRNGQTYFCYEPKGSGEAKAPRISSIVVDHTNQTITIEANGLVHWIYGTDKTSTTASSTRSSVVGIGKTFSYKGFQGTYVRAFITNNYGETCTQPISFIDQNAAGLENTQHQQMQLLVYPNPATDYISVFTKQIAPHEWIQVYDVSGRQLISQPSNGVLTTLSIDALSQGLYLVKVGQYTATFIKE